MTLLLLGTLAGVFITSSGIILAADTAVTESARPGVVTFDRKIEITGDHSAVVTTGNSGWEASWDTGHVVADFRGVVRGVAAELRSAKTTPVAIQLVRLVTALKREAEAKVFPGIEASFPDGYVSTVIVAGYEGGRPLIHYGRLRLDKTAPDSPARFVVEHFELRQCWLVAGRIVVAMGLIHDDPNLPEALRAAPAVVVVRLSREPCDRTLPEAHARAFFVTAVDATVALGASFGIPAGSVGGDHDVVLITEYGAGPIERRRRWR